MPQEQIILPRLAQEHIEIPIKTFQVDIPMKTNEEVPPKYQPTQTQEEIPIEEMPIEDPAN